MLRRLVSLIVLTAAVSVLGAGAAFACGGLVAPGHAEVLRTATTLSAWHNGYEHYVTGFEFAGTAREFGYIVPLPGVPSKIEKGGGWTLERLVREVAPPTEALFAAAGAPAARDSVQVLQQIRIDALDITVVRGGGADVAKWAKRHGFDLTSDTPQVLGAYSDQGAVFALAKFDAVAADRTGLIEGQGQTIHFTIPTAAPWIPLRILALGKTVQEQVDAQLFILTDHKPDLAPGTWMPGVSVRASESASRSLLSDLRSDQGMSWVPRAGMWLTALDIHTPAGALGYDLSIDGGGPVGAPKVPVAGRSAWGWWAAGAGLAALFVLMGARVRPSGLRPA